MLYGMTTSSPIFGLRREIDRLFEDTFARDGSSFTPAVDIKENDNEIRLDLELPGLKPEDVEITAEMLRAIGCSVERKGDTLHIEPTGTPQSAVPQTFTGRNRIPVLMLGPLLNLTGEAFVPGLESLPVVET